MSTEFPEFGEKSHKLNLFSCYSTIVIFVFKRCCEFERLVSVYLSVCLSMCMSRGHGGGGETREKLKALKLVNRLSFSGDYNDFSVEWVLYSGNHSSV